MTILYKLLLLLYFQWIKNIFFIVYRPLKSGGKRTVFLVNTVVLTQQQTEYIQNVTSLKTAKYSGDMNVDAWRKDKWFSEFEDNQVTIKLNFCWIMLIINIIKLDFFSF